MLCFLMMPVLRFADLCMNAALTLVYSQNVINSFDQLCLFIRNQYLGEVDDLLDYFKDTYIGRFHRNAPYRGAPLSIEHKFWQNLLVSYAIFP